MKQQAEIENEIYKNNNDIQFCEGTSFSAIDSFYSKDLEEIIKLQLKNCFWNNLSLDVQSHQFVVCNLSFVSLLSHSELKIKKLETYSSYSSYNIVSESTIGKIFGMTDVGSYYN